MRHWLMLLACGAILGVSATASADPHTEATTLFEEGRRLRDKGELERALVTFRASVAAEPSVGSLFNVGLANEALGRPQEALDAYRASAKLAHERNDPRETEVLGAVTALRAKHNHVVRQITPDVRASPGLVVVLDGERVAATQIPGEIFRPAATHELVVRATGRVDRTVRVGNREVVTVTLGDPVTPGQRAQAAPARGTSAQTWLGLGLVGAGVVTAVVGTVVALGYYADRDDAVARMKRLCNTSTPTATNGCALPGSTPPRPTPAARKILDDASNLDASATRRNAVVFGVAGALVVGGAFLFFTAPRKTKETTRANVRLFPDASFHDLGLHAVGEF